MKYIASNLGTDAQRPEILGGAGSRIHHASTIAGIEVVGRGQYQVRAETVERRTAVSLDALAEVDADFGQIDVTEVDGAQHVVEIMLGRVPLIYKTD